MSKKKDIPINSYATFKYVKQQLEQDLQDTQANLKGSFLDKIPFGLGNALSNSENADFKDALKKEAINSSIPVIKKIMFSVLKNNKKKMFIWGISAATGMLVSFFINKKLK